MISSLHLYILTYDFLPFTFKYFLSHCSCIFWQRDFICTCHAQVQPDLKIKDLFPIIFIRTIKFELRLRNKHHLWFRVFLTLKCKELLKQRSRKFMHIVSTKDAWVILHVSVCVSVGVCVKKERELQERENCVLLY